MVSFRVFEQVISKRSALTRVYLSTGFITKVTGLQKVVISAQHPFLALSIPFTHTFALATLTAFPFAAFLAAIESVGSRTIVRGD